MINNTLFRPSVLRDARKDFNPEGFDLAAVLKARKAAEAAPPSDESLSQNAVLLSDSELAAFSGSSIVELIPGASSAEADAVIRAAYRQVFGNAHLMDSERSPEAESQLRSGQITVLDFIRQLAKSDRYRTLFFESCTNLRTVELNFKHLLGRAPESSEELSVHIGLLTERGFEAEIDSYLDSMEYFSAFGTMIVPYYRGYATQPGRSLAAFTHAFPLLRGASSSNKSMSTAGNAAVPQLQTALLGNQASEITPLASLPAPVPLIVADPDSEVPLTPEERLEKAFADVTFTPVGRPAGYYQSSEFLDTPKQLSAWLQVDKARGASSQFPAARSSQPVTLSSNASDEAADVVIRAAYKQVFGNAYLMESQRLVAAESQLKKGNLTVRGFIRELATSDIYRSLFLEKSSNVRLTELNFKHLLGRAPDSGQEISQHVVTLANDGFDADIDSYLNSEEYGENFGDDTVPYYVSYETQTGKNGAGYSRIFQLIKGACSSDKSVVANGRAQLQTALLKTARPVKSKNVFNPQGFELVKAPSLGGVAPLATATPYFNAFADSEPVELVSGDSAQQQSVVIEAAYQQVFGNAHLMESERSPLAESQLRSGQITVMEFIRLLAKSQRYRDLFFTPYTNVEVIKLNFKHLLGRAPERAEISEHSEILATDGFDAEIDAYLDSDEYMKTFGAAIVPYYRGYKTQPGQSLSGFTHSFSLLKGASTSNKSIARSTFIELDKSILGEQATAISALSTDSETFSQQVAQVAKAAATTPLARYVSLYVTTNADSLAVSGSRYIQPTQRSIRRQALLSPRTYESLESASPMTWVGGRSEQDIELVINAVYKQVLGNAYVMESERLTVPESRLRSGQLTIREFVRVMAKSDLYKSRFIDNSPRYRSHEVNFKHLLGRAPDNYEETRFHSHLLDNHGYDADIDAYIDSDEYQAAFGEDTVPYCRGYKTQLGQSPLGYNNTLELLPSVSTSDKAVASVNKPQLQTQLLPWQSPTSGNTAVSYSSASVTAQTSSAPVDLIRSVLGLA